MLMRLHLHLSSSVRFPGRCFYQIGRPRPGETAFDPFDTGDFSPGLVSTHRTLQHRTAQRNALLIAVHSTGLRGHHWSCQKMLSAFPLKEGKTAHMLSASRSAFMVAFVPSADRTLHSAGTDQRRLSTGHRCLCLPDHRKLHTGRTHQRKDCRQLRRRGNPAA